MNTKKCTKCKEVKGVIEFQHWRNVCKKCRTIQVSKYYREHKEHLSIVFKEWLSMHREERKKYCKKWYQTHRLSYCKHKKEYTKNLYKNKPWLRVLKNVKSRVHPVSLKRKKNRVYRKIKNFLTGDDIKFLWDRDNTVLMKRPSIHRKDGKGDYTKNNCEFLELSEHLSRR